MDHRFGVPALLLIDVQQGLDDPRWGARNNPQAEQCIADLYDSHYGYIAGVEPSRPLRVAIAGPCPRTW